MKQRVLTLAMVCAFVLGSAVSAQAIDIKVKGQWEFTFGWADNYRGSNSGHGAGVAGFKDKGQGNGVDSFNARHRVRTQIDFVASEQLKGVLMFEIGDINWGRDGGGRSGGNKSGPSSGGDLDADGVNVETKRAYLDWMIPNTDITVRMGLQGIALPSATRLNNPVFNTDCAGILISSPITDWLTVSAFWVRAFDRYDDDSSTGHNDSLDEMDIFALITPITLDGMKITPWGAWARIGGESGYWGYHGKGYGTTNAGGFDGSTNAYYVGLGYELTMFDPLTFSFDVIYGWMHGNQGVSDLFTRTRAGTADQWKSNPGSEGWFVDFALRYKLDWATAGLFGWWSSGDDANAVHDGRFGRLPVLGADTGFAPTSFGFDGSKALISSDRAVSNSGVGLMGIGVELADMSFIEDLSHTIRFAYYRGTNDSEVIENYNNGNDITRRRTKILTFEERQYMTDKDQAFEINFDHKYQIYENLAAFLELSWIHMDLDEDVWENANDRYDGGTKDAWKAQLSFQFKF